MNSAASAIGDLGRSVKRFPLAAWLALDDIHGKYRRTVLGPLWIAIGQATLIGGFTLVFSGLFQMDPAQYLLYLAAGFPTWTLISQFLIDMPFAFISAKGVIESYELPWLTQIWRRACGYLFTFFHHLLAIVGAMLVCWIENLAPISIGPSMLLLFPALLIVLVAGSGVGLVLAVVNARYRDLQPAMGVIASFLMLLSPVVWRRDQMQINTWIVDFNPLYYFLRLVRDPLLNKVPPPEVWVFTGISAVIAIVVGVSVFAVARRRLYHWL